jgi:hypothetical protein
MSNKYDVTAYYVKGCKVDKKTIFTGYVLCINNEDIIDSIKRKVGRNSLLCEMTNEGFEYDMVNTYSIPMTELTLGDVVIITGNYNISLS